MIVVVPALRNVAKPCEPWNMEMVATAVFDDVQVTVDVRSSVVPSDNTPVAVNCTPPTVITILGLDGVTEREVRTGAVTVSVIACDVIPPKRAVTSVVPCERAVAIPFDPVALLTIAT